VQPQLYLAGVLRIARRRWWALLAGVLAGVVLVVAGTAGSRSGFEGSVKLLVGPMGGQYTELRAASQQAETYADLATSTPVLRAARAPAGSVSAKADYFTRLLTITAQARGRARAAATANAVAAALMRATGPRRAASPGELTKLGPVETSPAASGARRKTLVAIAALAGLLAALTLSVSLDRRRRRLAAAVVASACLLVVATPAAGDQPLEPGIWLSRSEVQKLPEQGPAWDQVKRLADEPAGQPDLSNQDSEADVHVLAEALVFARTDDERLRSKAAAGVVAAIGTEHGGRTLALARGLVAYVVAADLIDLRSYDPTAARRFASWLAAVRNEDLEPSSNPTLVATHELRPNNWGTHAGASRIAADIYLGDRRDLARAAAVFKGWLGDRAIYHGFDYGEDLSWQANPDAPVGVDPPGAVRDGESLDGALPDDMRRGCSMRFPPCPTLYPWEAMEGAAVQAELLSRQGYDAWDWGDQALRRAATFLFNLHSRYGDSDWGAPAGHAWVPWLLNARYGTHFPATTPAQPGKGMGFTDWTAADGCPTGGCTQPRGAVRQVTPVAARPVRGHSGSGGSSSPPLGAAAAGVALILLISIALLTRRHRARSGVR
jgi:hypothetical protein